MDNEIAPSGSGVDSSWDHVLYDNHSGRIAPGLIQYIGQSFKSFAFTAWTPTEGVSFNDALLTLFLPG